MESGGKTWWVYMLSCRGGKIYTGTALDPEARFRSHRDGKGAAFTRANPPLAVLRRVPFGSRRAACRAEAALKKLSREKKLSWSRGEYPFWEGVNMARVPYVKKNECISCGVCERTLPAVFRLDDDSLAEVHDPNGADEASIQQVVDLCPVNCIYWEDKE